MNAKAKKVIAAYAKAIKHAHKPDSRIRLMFIGDSAAGKNYIYMHAKYMCSVNNSKIFTHIQCSCLVEWYASMRLYASCLIIALF